MRNELILPFLRTAGYADADITPLAGDASSRWYARLWTESGPLILMDAPPPEDVGIFADIAVALRLRGYSAPAILAEDRKSGLLLLEDLGDDIFARLMEKGAPEAALYRLAVDFLVDLGKMPPPDFLPEFSDAYIMAQNEMFLDYYVPEKLGAPLGSTARIFYEDIWRNLLPRLRVGPEVMLLRDFHSENLLYLKDREGVQALGLLDFQDALKGPPAYDLASLLQDARRQVDDALAEEMIYRYLDATGLPEQEFRLSYAILGAHRALRIMGIFIRLAREQGKTRYLGMIPRMQGYLGANLAHSGLAALDNWLRLTIGEGKS
ncbi:aminoglycoside phosphotransferase family protein [Sneathiella sp.]|uniref:aminoglycoside phosphotransferase family protein n=1 Tax=Sneathiella sp. TaxID=1964365 RepID=UPI002FE327B0